MSATEETDTDFDVGDEEAVSEGQRWAQLGYTRQFTQAARQQALKELDQLIGAASVSADPKVAAAHGRYVQQKALCEVLAKALKGKDAKSGLP